MSTLSALAAMLVSATLGGCLSNPEDPARLWVDQRRINAAPPVPADPGVQTVAAQALAAPAPAAPR